MKTFVMRLLDYRPVRWGSSAPVYVPRWWTDADVLSFCAHVMRRRESVKARERGEKG